jgi:hypothetical protein
MPQISAYLSLRKGGRKAASLLQVNSTCLSQGSRPHRPQGTPASPFLEPPHDLENRIFTMDDSLILTALRVSINFAIIWF